MIKKHCFRAGTALAVAAGFSLATAGSAHAGVSLESDSGWSLGVNGWIPVFALSHNPDQGDESFRITTGFNPATVQFNVAAPETDGLAVSAHVQVNNHLSGADAAQNSGFGRSSDDDGFNSGVESRVAKFVVSGDFGALDIGKGFGLFGTPAIGDTGSAKGVGLFAPNAGEATGGRIGNGYFYANFNPRVIYSSNTMGGLQFKVGAFQPVTPGDNTEASTPRVEGSVTYSTGMLTVWSSAGYQSVENNNAGGDDFDMSGIDFGGAVSVGRFNVRANYAMTSGTGGSVWGGDGVDEDETDFDQWYVEGTYGIGAATLGASYGEGEADDANASELLMVFAHYDVRDWWTVMVEVQDFQDSDRSTDTGDYNAFILGSQFTF